jgi:hypothetical protein
MTHDWHGKGLLRWLVDGCRAAGPSAGPDDVIVSCCRTADAYLSKIFSDEDGYSASQYSSRTR